MRVLYSIFAESEEDAALILEHVLSERLARVGGSVTDGCILTVQYDTVAVASRVDLMAAEFTQEIVGSCWDALISAHVSFPRDVWLSTYDAATITRIAPARSRVIGGITGHVLHPNELDTLLALPVDRL